MNASAPAQTKEVHTINWLLFGLIVLALLVLSISPLIAAAKSIDWAFTTYHVEDKSITPVVPVRAPAPPDARSNTLPVSTPEPAQMKTVLTPVPMPIPTPPSAP